MIKKIKSSKPRDEWIPNTWHGYANACGLQKNKKKQLDRDRKHKNREEYWIEKEKV